MTTITFRDGIMASDSISSSSGIIRGSYQKIRQIGAYLVGCSGSASHIESYFIWLQEQQDQGQPLLALPPKEIKGNDDKAEVFALIANARSQLWKVENGGRPFPIKADFYALGTGYEVALGAMAHGATAEEAVRIAIRFDNHSGGDVQILKTADLPA